MLAAISIDILGNNSLFAGERGIIALFCGSNGYPPRCVFQLLFCLDQVVASFRLVGALFAFF
jgi:hypothetical protein